MTLIGIGLILAGLLMALSEWKLRGASHPASAAAEIR
jgi:hypothetical protein